MKISHILILLCCTFILSNTASAQSTIDLSDVGRVAMENSGAPEAQQAFLHGLAQLHNFEYGFAAEDFREAQSIDPDFALAYWGEAMTYNHPIWMQQDRDAALAALNKYAPTPESRQKKAPTEFARDLLTAVDILYGQGEKQDRDDLYNAYMARLYEKYPDNVEIAAQYALSIMGTAHEGREFGLYMRAAAIMQKFIVDYPQHPGVAHYLIHATDDPIHAPLGLAAAEAYSGIAPNAAHAQHMTTHIFLALGDWDGVIRANIRASELVNGRRAAEGNAPAGCGHYPSWLMYGYLQQGKRDAAHEIMALCRKNIQDKDLEGYGSQSYYAWQRALYLFDTKEWAGDIALEKADVGDDPRVLFWLNALDAYVAMSSGNDAAADEAYEAAKASLAGINEYWDAQGVPADYEQRIVPAIQLMQLEARRTFDAGDTDDAIALMREAVAREKELSFGFGPPDPPKPGLEMLGEMLVEVGQYEEARTVLTEALSRTPNKALSLKALQKAEAKLASTR